MSDDILDDILEKYGIIGGFLAALGTFTLVLIWVLCVALWVWPALLPILALLYMIWSVRK